MKCNYQNNNNEKCNVYFHAFCAKRFICTITATNQYCRDHSLALINKNSKNNSDLIITDILSEEFITCVQEGKIDNEFKLTKTNYKDKIINNKKVDQKQIKAAEKTNSQLCDDIEGIFNNDE